jgi:hypothetical protein
MRHQVISRLLVLLGYSLDQHQPCIVKSCTYDSSVHLKIGYRRILKFYTNTLEEQKNDYPNAVSHRH